MPHESEIYPPTRGKIGVCGERWFAGSRPPDGFGQWLAKVVCPDGFNLDILFDSLGCHHFRRPDAKLYHADVDNR